MRGFRVDDKGWIIDKTVSVDKNIITMNLAGLPKGKVILRIDGEIYQSYYRRGNKLFIRPVNSLQKKI